jgi:medium-chain acyl-[acyl-carrier-protein] hydrolase
VTTSSYHQPFRCKMENSTHAIHNRTFRLHSYEVDQSGRARPDILLSFMLDTAWSHTKDTEFSYTELKDEGQLWVLSRFLAVFHDLPKWDDEITVETWGKGTDKLFGLRDFIIHSKSGGKLVSATSAWLIIDRKTSRIQRIDTLGKNFPMQLDRNELDVGLEKIDPQPSEQTDFEYVVRYSDLDVNKHVNSSKYVQWIIDSFPSDLLDHNVLGSFEINYLSEAKLNDRILVSISNAGEYHYCEIRRETDSVELCRAKVTWNG